MNDEQPVAAARILVVEDDALVRDHVVALLRSLGHDTVQAGDGAAALKVLSEDPTFDLLFTDVMMPGGLTGHRLVAEARRLVPDLRVLLTSGFPEKAERHNGADAPLLLAKPYRRAELQAALAEAMGRGVSSVRQ